MVIHDLFSEKMESAILTLSLLVSVCVGVFLLCGIIIYLCVMVRRIRRDVDELIRNKNTNISLEDIRNKEAVNVRERTISGNPRYTGDPVNWRKRKHNSSIYSEPGEPVIFLERNDSQSNAGSTQQLDMEYASAIQNPTVTEIQATPQQIPYQYSNKGFSPEITRNSTVRDSVSDDSQPVYGNEEVFSDGKPPGENNNEVINEPVYQNTGELAVLNNPEWQRTYTMNISDFK